MTAERTLKTPLPKEAKPNSEPTTLVSEKTFKSATPVAEKMMEGKLPDPKDVSGMVDLIAADLKAQGIALSSEDIRIIKERAEQGQFFIVSPSQMNEGKKPRVKLSELPEINLNEYQTVLDDFVTNYGLDKGAWNRISALLIGSNLTGQVLDAFYRKKIQSSGGFENIMETFRNISRNELKLHEKTPGQFVDYVLPWKAGEHPTKKTLGNVAKLTWGAISPILLSPVYWFADRMAHQQAGKLFMNERAKLQEQVNNRIADSVYMRNFEFVHDQSAGEMLEVINRGKDATMDLVSAVYEQHLPLKWMQAGAVATQLIVHPVEFASALTKKLILDRRTIPNARRIQAQRIDELEKWDKVNTKLLSTLQGLETVRTAGNAEAGSDVMYQSLAERDYVEAGGLREKRIQDKDLNKLFDFMDISIPVLSEGLNFRKFLKENNTKHVNESGVSTFGPVNAEDAFNYVGGAWFHVTGSMQNQQALRQSFMELTHLYTDRIIPDIQDIKRMDELLGPYQALDHPLGLKERSRMPVSKLGNFDIRVQDLKFKNILRGVNLDIPQGSFVTIKGPSGVGKSTLFRHLVGLYEGDGGTVSYGGTQMDRIRKYGNESLYTKIAYANQNPQYFEDMTLRDNLLLWSSKNIPDEQITTVLRDLKLDQIVDRLDTKTKHFSGGEMRRIGIARALLKDPKVLFLDEPTANLDAASTVQVMNIIRELRKKRPDMTVVAITHDPVFEKIAEKVVDFETINPKADGLADNQVFEAKAKAKQEP